MGKEYFEKINAFSAPCEHNALFELLSGKPRHKTQSIKTTSRNSVSLMSLCTI